MRSNIRICFSINTLVRNTRSKLSWNIVHFIYQIIVFVCHHLLFHYQLIGKYNSTILYYTHTLDTCQHFFGFWSTILQLTILKSKYVLDIDSQFQLKQKKMLQKNILKALLTMQSHSSETHHSMLNDKSVSSL